jgi:hypothetical protein
VFAILAILVVAGWIWLALNPLFPSPKTGNLHASASRDLSIGAGQATLAVQLEARINDNATKTSSGQPGPPTLSARITPTETGSVEGVRLLLAPGDATGPSSAVLETQPGRLDWTMPCPDGQGKPCRQLVVLIVEAPPSTTERKLRLTVDGDLRYPTYTPTPGWSSFDLDLRSVGPQAGMGANPVADAGGTVELAMDRPVISVPVHVEYGAAPSADHGPPPAALRLALEAVRLTETAPAGFDAPEPVRATVFGADGTVVARLGVRPGEAPTLSVALGPCASGCAIDYRIAFEWMDRRPEADYRLTWGAGIIGLPADDRSPVSVSVRAGAPEVAALAGTALAPPPGAGRSRAQRLEVAVAGLPAAGVAPNPLHVQMLITATVDPAVEIGTDVVRIEPYPFEGRTGLAVPFNVEPGQAGAIVVNLEDGCTASRCDRWALQSSTVNRTGASPSDPLEVTWQLDVRAWHLLPDSTALTLSLEVQ